MKKIALIMAIVLTVGVLLSSCRQTSSCSAYGEYKNYQKESVY